MASEAKRKGSFWHRSMIWSLSALLTVLVFWLLGFVVRDIGNIEGPDYDAIEGRFVSEELVSELESLQEERAEVERGIRGQREIQDILRQSMNESRSTMNQLVEIHRLSLEKDVTPTEDAQRALSESERLFIAKQQEFQAANELIAQQNAILTDITENIRVLNRERLAAAEPAREAFEEEQAELDRLRQDRQSRLNIARDIIAEKEASARQARTQGTSLAGEDPFKFTAISRGLAGPTGTTPTAAFKGNLAQAGSFQAPDLTIRKLRIQATETVEVGTRKVWDQKNCIRTRSKKLHPRFQIVDKLLGG